MSTDSPSAREAVLNEATVKMVAGWINQLGRTLKTCRLYDGNNPTVIRFREELAISLARLLEEQGPIELQFTDEDVTFGGASVHSARSRDDNLAIPFHRDGIRRLTFHPGIEPREVDALLDAVLQVSGQNIGQDDLVTLLWEAGLQHVEMDYVAPDADIGTVEQQEGDLVPWPRGDAPEPGDASAPEAGEPGGDGSRSDDWTTGALTVEIESGFAELDGMAPWETDRFRREFEAEHEVSPTTTALAILRATLSSGVAPEDRSELAQFAPRLLRLAMAQGAWLEAREAGQLLRTGAPEDLESLIQELLQPISVSTAVAHLDQQDAASVHEFILFAEELGEGRIDLLNAALGESQQRRNRRLLAEAIARNCKDNPERLAPYLNDPRWYVVRNVVHILGWIGGNTILGMLKAVLDHSEPRVRYEAVAALGQVELKLARPLLFRLLETSDTRMFCAALHQLSSERDPVTARLLLDLLLRPTFEGRPPEERRAIYAALSSVGGDEVVPELEAELLKGNWFARGQETHRQAVARILARIGSPLARMVLQRGLLSKRGPVRKACEEALSGMAA